MYPIRLRCELIVCSADIRGRTCHADVGVVWLTTFAEVGRVFEGRMRQLNMTRVKIQPRGRNAKTMEILPVLFKKAERARKVV
jgi:hypothetical protein